ncbi:GNAT family N-acetyltransferase [Paenibacillus agilis]|uniref:GNAT family N-acetyltransferase n=1 Tax=Paenibacillus agilis TaxID=3020863 RepID=A0A559J3H9_9BACL|nr:GNAT family N-acetyltransferase [Paenibacillus agilis]TVX94421.1 GNAT family N-acetyltransferase [Paenibacillus agilis]
MIELRKITGDNIDEVIELEVGEHQKDFIQTTNLRSIADAYVLNADGIPATPFAIYADEVVVGFLMYDYDTLDHESFENEVFYEKKSYFIWHIMIDKSYQGKGYGRLALEKMLTDIETMPYGEAEYVALFYRTSNVKAKTLYASFGFVDTGIIQDDNSMFAIKSLDTFHSV